MDQCHKRLLLVLTLVTDYASVVQTKVGRKKRRECRKQQRLTSWTPLSKPSKPVSVEAHDNDCQTCPEGWLLCSWCGRFLPPTGQLGHEAACRAEVVQRETEARLMEQQRRLRRRRRQQQERLGDRDDGAEEVGADESGAEETDVTTLRAALPEGTSWRVTRCLVRTPEGPATLLTLSRPSLGRLNSRKEAASLQSRGSAAVSGDGRDWPLSGSGATEHFGWGAFQAVALLLEMHPESVRWEG
ncbi:unnamed protein product [Protopolystoma xenopodis]|uniref:Uncharacterized protein n=1 Tax=Protopolystoma xenopodis TaxID=117903 RepID=A0A448XMV7_9PLAT|nr:unnamed protein product [Protopolystoma xenopodis]